MRSFITALLLLASFTLHAASPDLQTVGGRITVTIRGEGPNVVLIPGLASSRDVWNATVDHLKGRYRIHVVQVAGFAGASPEANGKGPVIQPTVDAVDAYIKNNHLKAPAIIGHSLGGLMGMMLAQQHPEDVGKLMIVDALPFYGALFGAGSVTEIEPRAVAIRDAILAQSQESFAQSQSQMMGQLVKSPEGRKVAMEWSIASDRSVVARAMYEDMITDLRPKIRDIKANVTMLYPWDAGTGVPQATFDGMYQQSFADLPKKTLVRVDGSLHFIMLDQPETFERQVDAFLTPAKP